MMEFLSPLLAAFGLAAAGTYAVRGVARRFGLVVAPRADRWHAAPTAMYGGVAIALAVMATMAVIAGSALFERSIFAAIMAAAVVLFAVGLVDDARGIGPVGKFILQLTAGTLLIVGGVIYPVTPWNPVNVLVTLFWFVGIVNALNLLDNMDGVTAGVSAVAALAFASLFAAAGDVVLTTLALATAGAAVGFLVFNFKPASIFMGDGGSLFLGGVLAGLGAAYPLADGSVGPATLLVPGLILLVPVLDTALVTVTRTLHNRRISAGGRDHSTHRLVAMGFSESGAALFLYAFGVSAFAVAAVIVNMGPGAGMWLGLSFLTGALVFTAYLGRLHRYDAGYEGERAWRGLLFRNILVKRRGLELLLDVVLFGVAWYGAALIHHDGSIPERMGPLVNGSLGVVIVLKLAVFHYFRVYRAIWDRAGLADVHRIIKAALVAGVVVFGASLILAPGSGIPGGVFILDTLLTGTLALAARSSFRSLERFRQRLGPVNGDAVLICGTGVGADLILSALPHTERGLRVIGYVDERQDMTGTLIHGLPVLGSLHELGALIGTLRPSAVVLSSDIVDGRSSQLVLQTCRASGIELLQLHIELTSTADGIPGRRNGDQTERALRGTSDGRARLAPALRMRPAENPVSRTGGQ
ncbi:MAG TPA: hypothetical protein VK912_11990 [Longimicrobiales bacterium]|nr:hypothetical protein [Longimicrobiales bacterium]